MLCYKCEGSSFEEWFYHGTKVHCEKCGAVRCPFDDEIKRGPAMIVDDIFAAVLPPIIQGALERKLGEVRFELNKVRRSSGFRSDSIHCALDRKYADDRWRSVGVWIANDGDLDSAVMPSHDVLSSKVAWVIDQLTEHSKLP